jgi:hypothetical protein
VPLCPQCLAQLLHTADSKKISPDWITGFSKVHYLSTSPENDGEGCNASVFLVLPVPNNRSFLKLGELILEMQM